MQEKELRLALVCFGGISLAIYIHGTTKEILKLVRASKAYHSNPDINSKSHRKYIYPNHTLTDPPDTELVYFDILKALSPELELRVIVDTIAGASAGGINSIFLGRALAHDLDMDHLRQHWLEEADVSFLTGDKKLAGTMDKIISKPLIRYFSSKYLGDTKLAELVRQKLPSLMNIWKLKPPFDGKHFLGLIYKGLSGMGHAREQSLMPYGHQLDLFVTVTDYYGFRRDIPINDPPVIHEREHRHKLHFSFINKINGTTDPKKRAHIISDFDELDKPALSFAARATACYPGAFPPAQLREVESFLKRLDRSWTKKAEFLQKNFREYKLAGIDPMKTSFLDGSILNNKPFDQAIGAIQGRPAFREVDRRIIYIDPNPERPQITAKGPPPSLLNTIKGALSDIPMNQPMHDDLMEIQAHNQQIRTIKMVIDNCKPGIEEMVTELAGSKLENLTLTEEITYQRLMSNVKSVAWAGFSYGGYARLKVRNTVADMTKVIGEICNQSSGSSNRRSIFTILHNMTFQDNFNFAEYTRNMEQQARSGLLSWVKTMISKKIDDKKEPLPFWGYLLSKFDIKYQRRRLLFVIKELNTHYAKYPNEARKLDRLKKNLYDILEQMTDCTSLEALSPEVKKSIRAAFLPLLKLDINDDMRDDKIKALIKDHEDKIKASLDKMADWLCLDHYKNASDELIAAQNKQDWQGPLAKNLMISYIGFSFWDVTTFSIMGSRELGEFNEIKINRISPNDKSILKDHPDDMPLLGTALGGFGAFFSRADRENDYLWGRLNSAERLIDLLSDQARLSNIAHKLDVRALKKRAFLAILNAEKDFLQENPDLLIELKEKVEAL